MARRSVRLIGQSDQAAASIALGSIYTNPPAPTTQDDEIQAADNSHLMRLPAELRNRVYSLVFASTPKQNIDSFSTPALTQVSKQLRSESLPLFFAETTFHMAIGANLASAFSAIFRRSNPFSYHGTRPGHLDISGVIVARPLSRAHNKVALFRNVVFEVYDSLEIEMSRTGVVEKDDESRKCLDMHLRVGARGALELVVQEGLRGCRGLLRRDPSCAIYAEKVRDFEGTQREATSIARNIAATKRFKGFKMKDLQRIATAFKVEE